jgi:hypothetical protein
MANYTDGSTILGVRLKTGRIVYELRDKLGKPVMRGEFNSVVKDARAARVYPEILDLIEEEEK